MDCLRNAMASLVELKDQFDIDFGNDQTATPWHRYEQRGS